MQPIFPFDNFKRNFALYLQYTFIVAKGGHIGVTTGGHIGDFSGVIKKLSFLVSSEHISFVNFK